MKHVVIRFVGIMLCLLSFNAIAQQSGGGSSELKNTCEVSGGTYTESSRGWACCWANWGCYGCLDGLCKVKCYTRRCRIVNYGTPRPSASTQEVEGLAPKGMKAPIIPKPKTAPKQEAPSAATSNKPISQ
jgi:hypothetical protein